MMRTQPTTTLYNRTIRAHKLTVEVLWHIMWPNFQAWAQDRGIGEELHRLSEEVATSMDDSGDLEWPSNPIETLKTLEEQVEGRDLLQLLEEYDKHIVTNRPLLETLQEDGHDLAAIYPRRTDM